MLGSRVWPVQTEPRTIANVTSVCRCMRACACARAAAADACLLGASVAPITKLGICALCARLYAASMCTHTESALQMCMRALRARSSGAYRQARLRRVPLRLQHRLRVRDDRQQRQAHLKAEIRIARESTRATAWASTRLCSDPPWTRPLYWTRQPRTPDSRPYPEPSPQRSPA